MQGRVRSFLAVKSYEIYAKPSLFTSHGWLGIIAPKVGDTLHEITGSGFSGR